MQTSQIISIIANVILSFSLVSMLFGPRLMSYIRNKKKQRERQEVKRIQSIVNDYLNKLKND